MRQSSTPKRFLALALSAGILTGGLALNSTTAGLIDSTGALLTASSPQTGSTGVAAPTGWFDRFKRNWREAARKYREEDERAARNFQ